MPYYPSWIIYPSLQEPTQFNFTPPFNPANNEAAWHQDWSRRLLPKIDPKHAIALAAAGAFMTPVQTGELITTDKWFNWLSEPVRLPKGLRAQFQQTLAYDTRQIETVMEDKWHQGWSIPNDLRKRGLAAHLQRDLAIPPNFVPIEVVYEDKWHQGWSIPPVLAKQGLRADQQRTLAYVRISPISPFTQGYIIC